MKNIKIETIFFLAPRKVYRWGKSIPLMEPILTRFISLVFISSSILLLLLRRYKYRKQLREILRQHEQRKGIIVYPSPVNWDFVLFQRPHQFALSFAKKGYLFFFCNPSYNKKGPVKLSDSLFVCGRDFLNVLGEIPIDVLLITPKIDMKNIVQRFIFSNLVYDYIDDLSVWAWGESKYGQGSHKYMIKNSDLVIASATRLFNEIRREKRKSILIPNGVDYDHFNDINSYSIPPDLSKSKKGKQIIGFYGALAEWIDYELIRYIAEKNEKLLIVLIGLDTGGFIRRHSLDKIKNILFLGPKDYKVLPGYLSLFDVAIIPFKVNRVSEATSPIKLFEYMAAGKPVVTTSMPECRKYKGVFVSSTYDNFNQNIYLALKKSKDKTYNALLKSQASQNTWEKRVGAIIKVLE